jgi:hypothetical protein
MNQEDHEFKASLHGQTMSKTNKQTKPNNSNQQQKEMYFCES